MSELDKLVEDLQSIADEAVARQKEQEEEVPQATRRKQLSEALKEVEANEAEIFVLPPADGMAEEMGQETAAQPEQPGGYGFGTEDNFGQAGYGEAPLSAGVPEGGASEADLYALLNELRNDINVLKQQQALQPAPAVSAEESQLYGLLAELRNDIEALKQEQRATLPPATASTEDELRQLLAELRGDIEHLKQEQRMQGIPVPSATAPAGTAEAELYQMLAELRQDISVLKEQEHGHYRSHEERYASLQGGRTGSRLLTIGALGTAVIAAGAAGYFYSISQQQGGTDATRLSLAPAPVARSLLEPRPAANPSESALISASDISGRAGEPLPVNIGFSGINVAPDTVVVITGLPPEATLSAGDRRGNAWVLAARDLAGLKLRFQEGFSGVVSARINLLNQEGVTIGSRDFRISVAPTSAAGQPEGAAPEAGATDLEATPQVKLSPPEVNELIARADSLLEQGDVISARMVLRYAVSQGSAEAAVKLARMYDPKYMDKRSVLLGVKPDITEAKVLYFFAASRGNEFAAKRLSELK